MSELPDHTFGYERDGSAVLWDVKDLWSAAELLKPVEIDITLLNSGIDDVQKHYDTDDWERVDESELKYPILVGRKVNTVDYLVIDGYHRLAKHRKLGHTKVAAKVLTRMPLPFSVKGKPFKIDGLNFIWRAKVTPKSKYW